MQVWSWRCIFQRSQTKEKKPKCSWTYFLTELGMELSSTLLREDPWIWWTLWGNIGYLWNCVWPQTSKVRQFHLMTSIISDSGTALHILLWSVPMIKVFLQHTFLKSTGWQLKHLIWPSLRCGIYRMNPSTTSLLLIAPDLNWGRSGIIWSPKCYNFKL